MKVKSLSRVRLFATHLPGSSVHGIFQARVLEWVAISSSRGFATRLPGSSVHGIFQARVLAGDLPDPGIEPGSPALQADALPSEPPGKPLRESYLGRGIISMGFPDGASGKEPTCLPVDTEMWM